MTLDDIKWHIRYHKSVIRHHESMIGEYMKRHATLKKKQEAARKKRDEKFATEETTRIIDRIRLEQ